MRSLEKGVSTVVHGIPLEGGNRVLNLCRYEHDRRQRKVSFPQLVDKLKKGHPSRERVAGVPNLVAV